MDKIEMFCPMEKPPTVTAQDHHRVTVTSRGRRIVYRDSKLRQARQALESAFQAARPPDFTQAHGPISLTIGLIYPYRRADRAVAREGAAVWKTSRPDLDNQSKEITDSLMSCGFFHDDSQIAELKMWKIYGPTPGIYIKIEHAENPEALLQQIRSIDSLR